MSCKTRCYKNLDRRIKKIEKDIELKYIESGVGGSAISGSSTFTSIVPLSTSFTGIVEGTTFNRRIGSSVNVTSLHVNLYFNNYDQTFGADVAPNIRVIIFWWKDPNGTATYPSLSDILTAPTTSGSINNVYAFYNFQNRESYKILYDEIFDMTAFAVNTDTVPDAYWNPGKATHTIRLKLPLNSTEIQYNGSTVYPLNKDLLMYIYSDSTASPHPSVIHNWRLYYKDA